MRKLLLLICLFVFVGNDGYAQTLMINEIMSSNDAVIVDFEGEYSDWIEVYNAGSSAVNLNDYCLSDKYGNLSKWRFGPATLEPGGFFLVFASGKDGVFGDEMHTNFKISSSGEVIYLTHNNSVVNQIPAVSLRPNQSFGHLNDVGEFHVMQTPTPCLSNSSVNQVFLSHDAGFYSEPFLLSIVSTNGDSVYYTINGDLPQNTSSLYAEPLEIKDRGDDENVFCEIPSSPPDDLISCHAWESPGKKIEKGAIIRYASFKNGVQTSDVGTETYLFFNSNRDHFSMPVISLITDGENLFNYDSGIYVPGIYFDNNNPEWSGNYFHRGESWERDVHIEMFDEYGEELLSQDAGLRIHGGKTRQVAQKSLRLYARREYGNKYFNCPILPKRENDEYKRFLLHTTMSSWGRETIIKDIVAQAIVSGLNVSSQTFQPAVVFIDGEYWGVHNIMDRIDEYYVEYMFGLDNDDVIFDDKLSTNYVEFLEFLEAHDLSVEPNYQYVQSRIVLDEYIDYMIAEMYMGNYDWPSNNVKFWRLKDNGRWRWVFFDLDAGMGAPNYNMFEHATKNDTTVTWPNSPDATLLFRKLLENDNFRTLFIDRYTGVLDNILTTDMMMGKLDSIKNLYLEEIDFHIERWHYPESFDEWSDGIDETLREFVLNRTASVSHNLQVFFTMNSIPDSEAFVYPGDNLFLVSPNPNNGDFYIQNISMIPHNCLEMSVFDLSGNVVFRKDGFDLHIGGAEYFSLPNVSQGIYMVEVLDGASVYHFKTIITK